MKTNLKTLAVMGVLLLPVFSGKVCAYSGGDGSGENPYRIHNANDMNEIGAHPNDWDKHFLLCANIDLAAYTGTSFNIIGTDSIPFTGVFDGNGHTISNFTYTSTSLGIGLFRYINDPDAAIKDLALINPNVDVGRQNLVGSLVACLTYGTISGCYAEGGSVFGYILVGGLVGHNEGGIIDNSHSGASVSGQQQVGGLVGENAGAISDCYSTGSVTGGIHGYTGGLVGSNWGTTTNCHSSGDVSGAWNTGGLVGATDGPISNCYATGSVLGSYRVGGLVGENWHTTVSNCYATGNVTATSEFEGNVGGLVGILYGGTITYCYSTGSGSGTTHVGGLVGTNLQGTVSNCYSTGSASGNDKVGGLLGGIDGGGTITNCYSAGSVSGTSNVGGLVGYDGASYTKSFWDNTINSSLPGIGNATDPNVIGESTTNMQIASTFTDAGWDFVGETINGANDIWVMFGDGLAYPKLSWSVPNIFVDASAPGANNGSSWPDAFVSLSDALEKAWLGVDILVAQGVYIPDACGLADPRQATFQLINGVAVRGGYPGYAAPDPNERDIEQYKTILSGDINTPDDNNDNSYHVVTASGTDANAILDGFTITAGNANGSGTERYGGGIYNDSGSPTVTNCTFTGNSADSGGAICNTNCTPTITNCLVGRNRAIYAGGMYNHGSSPALTNCTFRRNLSMFGGAVSNVLHSNPTVSNCLFDKNRATKGGGGMANANSDPKIINCTFFGNVAAEAGGGMANLDNSNPSLTNCILWANTAPSGPQILNIGGSSPTVNYSDVQGGWPGIGNKNEAPLFVDPDGPDDIAGTQDDNLRLSLDSPCIDAGDNNSVAPDSNDLDGDGNTTEPLPWDLDSRNRFADGDCNDSNVVDMGAYEFAWVYIGDFDGECDVDFADWALFAMAWLTEHGQPGHISDYDISIPPDNKIDWRDVKILCDNWLAHIEP